MARRSSSATCSGSGRSAAACSAAVGVVPARTAGGLVDSDAAGAGGAQPAVSGAFTLAGAVGTTTPVPSRWAAVSTRSSVIKADCSSTLRSSRMLPGQSRAASRSSASADKALCGRPLRRAMSSSRASASASMSLSRSRSAGSRIGSTLSR